MIYNAIELYHPRMMDVEDECGVVSGMTGRGNQKTWRKPGLVTLCAPQISHGLTLGSNLGSHGRKPAINRLSYGMAHNFNSSFVLLAEGPCMSAFAYLNPLKESQCFLWSLLGSL
jgi:hypothetical protein